MIRSQKIVITGIGPIASCGIGKDNLWAGLNKGESGIVTETFTLDKQALGEFCIHRVKGFDIKKFKINKGDLSFINSWKGGEDVDLNLMLAAVSLALDDGCIDLEKNSLGLIVSHENPSLEKLLNLFFLELNNKQQESVSNNFEKAYSSLVKTAYETQSFMLLFHIAKVFNIKKYSLYINNACASGLYALEAAADIIRSKKASQVVVVAGDSPNYFKHLWFKSLNMYPKDIYTKPFSNAGGGFLLGEGATALLLEDFSVAKKRGAKIYAEYVGGRFALDGWKITVPAIHNATLEKLIASVLKDYKYDPSKIDLICAHGVGTSLSDRYEAKSIRENFGRAQDAPLVTGLKQYIGHNLGGAALLESAILLLMMEKGRILPLLNCNYPVIESINIAKNIIDKPIGASLKICSAFAGYNGAVIFQKIK
jgi:3-oxoacyl-[acyl-carrier-protein] synthase II